ncbi:Kdo hydroxylase family protein, partial [Arthrobacter sp. EH-1B-1]
MVERLLFAGLEEAKTQPRAVQTTLEHGGLIEFASMGFAVFPDERDLIDAAAVSPKSKNISLGPGGAVRGTVLDPAGQARMRGMMTRFSSYSESIVQALLPAY